MNKYHNAKIYKIVDVGYNKCYIGSTTESLSMRMARHRSQYKKQEGLGFKVFSFELFDLYGIENCKIELMEKFSCETKEELLKREGEIIQAHDCVNKQVAGRTKKQWYLDNKDCCNEKSKQYRKENPEKMKEVDRKYREDHKDEIQEWKKKHYQENKDEINTKHKLYYQKNIEEIRKVRDRKCVCECGSTVQFNNRIRHKTTKKHQDYLKTLEPVD